MDPTATRPLGPSGLAVTRMGFGGAPLGNLFSAVAEAEAQATLAAAWDSGLRYFDTAPFYGHGLSERRFGAALGERPREAFVLSTKVGRRLRPSEKTRAADGSYVDTLPLEPFFDYSGEGALASLEASLDRLGLERIDILYIHDIDRMTHGADEQPGRYREAMAGAYPALHRLREAGRIGAIGLGVNEWEVCQRSFEDAELDCFLLAGQYSLLRQEALESFLPECCRRGVSIVIGGPYNSGILATGPVPGAKYFYREAPPEILERTGRIEAVCRAHGVPLAAAALQFPLHHPAVASVIPGARSVAELTENAALMRRAIPAALWSDLKTEGLLRPDAPTPGDKP